MNSISADLCEPQLKLCELSVLTTRFLCTFEPRVMWICTDLRECHSTTVELCELQLKLCESNQQGFMCIGNESCVHCWHVSTSNNVHSQGECTLFWWDVWIGWIFLVLCAFAIQIMHFSHYAGGGGRARMDQGVHNVTSRVVSQRTGLINAPRQAREPHWLTVARWGGPGITPSSDKISITEKLFA